MPQQSALRGQRGKHMTEKEKKMAAALAAVAAFMQQEEEAFHQQLAAAVSPPSKMPADTLNLWGQSGRQSMMQMRQMMQFKALHR
jgi:hypothetical protein